MPTPSFGLWSLIARHGGLVHPLSNRELAPLVEETVHPFRSRHQQWNGGAVQLVEPMGNLGEIYENLGSRKEQTSSHEPSWTTSTLRAYRLI